MLICRHLRLAINLGLQLIGIHTPHTKNPCRNRHIKQEAIIILKKPLKPYTLILKSLPSTLTDRPKANLTKKAIILTKTITSKSHRLIT